ncbi:MAG: putative alpha/beta-fold hydrolase [Lentimonas sp.]|jgi:predicted alpha/beta-fold hydrolase
MPYLHSSSYCPPPGFAHGHLQTIFPSLFRKTPLITQQRERIETPDGDFIDLDWGPNPGTSKLAILSHGLEGNSRRSYMQGMARALTAAGWQVLAWNFRGCSGEPNRSLQSYHSGSTGDLNTVIQHANALQRHAEIALVGFSLGGNITLKFLGDYAPELNPKICAAVAFSVTCDLSSSAQQLASWQNRIYMQRFLKTLRQKVREKALRFPQQLSLEGLRHIKSFREFDDAYTGPIHGYRDAADYWAQCSSLNSLEQIQVPALLINAADDPFLSRSCFPVELARSHGYFHFEAPRSGGHMGFVTFNRARQYWSEQRAVEFLTAHSLSSS